MQQVRNGAGFRQALVDHFFGIGQDLDIAAEQECLQAGEIHFECGKILSKAVMQFTGNLSLAVLNTHEISGKLPQGRGALVDLRF